MSKSKQAQATQSVRAILSAHGEMNGDPYLLGEIEITSMKSIPGGNGVEVEVAGQPESFIIINPPVYVEDPDGDYEPGDGKTYRHDPLFAIEESLRKHGGL